MKRHCVLCDRTDCSYLDGGLCDEDQTVGLTAGQIARLKGWMRAPWYRRWWDAVVWWLRWRFWR